MSDLSKPEKGSGKAERHQRRLARRRLTVKAQRAEAHRQHQAWKLVRRSVWVRDWFRCVVCQTPLTFDSGNPFTDVNAHHVIYRSAGGSDSPDNLVSLCLACHEGVHQHRVEIGPETLT